MKLQPFLRVGAFCLIALFSLNTQKAHATHAAGADLTYQCLGGLQYKINISFYRDCAGVSEPNSISLKYASASCGYNLTATANKIANTGNEITVPCNSAATRCTNGNLTGIRKFEYSVTVTLPAACSDWIFSYEVCCRNCAITTIQNPCANSTKLYVESKLNNIAAPCNSSPTFSNIPIAFVCIGQNFNYNHGVMDPNGDSLVYELIAPKISSSNTVTFIPPASTTTPVASSTAFSLNASTGDINFTPSQLQIGIMAIRVREFRNGVEIGAVIRDMQVYTQNCPNNLPTLSGMNNTTQYTDTICAGQNICFTAHSNDADAGQVVTLTHNNGIPGASVTTTSGNLPVATVCWTPTQAQVSSLPYSITFTVRDDACPTNGIQVYSYNIYVTSAAINVSSNNVSCYGMANGTASASPVGSGPLSYSWNTSPVQTNSSINGLSPGTYTVTATNSAGCTASNTVTITQPNELVLSNTRTDALCNGSANGSLTLSLSGGVSPFTYQWNNGATTQNVNGLVAGTYTVTVTQANGCTATRVMTVQQPSALSGSIGSVNNVACFGTNTGSAQLSISGGSPGYTYFWSNGSTQQNLSNAAAGNYTVTVTDLNGCTLTRNTTITQPTAALAGSTTVTSNVSCFSGNNGAIDLTVSGGTAPYGYTWNNGSTTQDISNISAGTYTVTITDSKGCTTTNVSTINQPVGALSTGVSVTNNVLCFGGNNGSININVTGGTTPYTYTWSNGATTQNIANLVAGTYSVSVVDVNGCNASLNGIIIDQPGFSLSGSSIVNPPVSCFGGNDGALQVSINGGTLPYTYNWNNGASTQNISNLSSGTYTVLVTDVNGCTLQLSQNVSQPTQALAAWNNQVSNVDCFGNNSGSVDLSVAGGTGPYTYLWNTGGTVQDPSNMSSGNYTVTVTDANGCTATNVANIGQPSNALNASITSSTNVGCFGNATGSINLSVNGGTGPYTYLWNTGGTVEDPQNLSMGSYTVTVSDINGCTATQGISISQPSNPLSSSIGFSSNVTCFGAGNGSINLTVNGGTSPYTYNWSNGMSSQNLVNLSPGVFSVTITDANGCTSSQSASISQPTAALSSTIQSTIQVDCFSNNTGAATVSVAGGTSPYTYLWNNGSTSQNINNVNAGTYTLTVTDANGCTHNRVVVISQPAQALNSSISSTSNVNCFGNASGSINLSVNGGTSPYSYNWSNGSSTQNISALNAGVYTVVITDANGCTRSSVATITQPSASLQTSVNSTNAVACHGNSTGSITINVNGGTSPYSFNWSNGSTVQNPSALVAGVYTVNITDANGCTQSASTTITQPSASLTSSVLSQVQVSCFGNNTGTLSLNVNGGTAPYSYNWSNGSSASAINNLAAGNYSVTVSDANGCTSTLNAVITQPNASLVSSVASTTNILCNGNSTGVVNINVNGGTAPYTYSWSNGASSQNISGLSSGTYTVSVVDVNGCTAIASASLTQPTALTATVNTNNATCGVANGDATISANGGAGSYTYLWSNGATSASISNLNTGSYSVTVTDANGCSYNTAANISNLNGPQASIASNTAVDCFGNSNGSLTVNVSGGTLPISYLWSNGASTLNLSNVVAGNYTLTITDLNNCISLVSGTIAQPTASLSSSTSSLSNVDCFGNASGSVSLNTNGGTAPYSFTWSNGATTSSISNLSNGTYSVSVIDANGCTTQHTVNISQPAQALQTSISNNTAVDCFGNASGSLSVTTLGGTPNYTYVWSNGANGSSITNVVSGIYTVSITDINGCTTSISGTITQPSAALTSSVSGQSNVDCFSNSTGSIQLSTNGGTAPYTYNWSNGASTQNISSLTNGTYSVTITDLNGCTTQLSQSITQPSAALASAVNSQVNVDCNGNTNGAIDISASGGTSPYTFIWSNGATTEDVNGLTSGIYTVTITDINGCSTIMPVNITQPSAQLNSNVTANVAADCFGANTGSLSINVSGGTTPYTYLWNNGTTTQNLINIPSGTYTVAIVDSNGCAGSLTATITQPVAPVSPSIGALTAVACFGDSTGVIDLTVSGGTSPYLYSWNTGDTNEDLSNLVSGMYSVTITDANGCTDQMSINVAQPAAPLLTNITQQTNISCFGGNNGIIDLTVNGGTQPYIYAWNTGDTNEDLSGLIAGAYSVLVTDANGCTTTIGAMLNQPSAPLTGTISTQNANCWDQSSATISTTASGGTSPYTFSWSNGASTQNQINLYAGTYTVTVADANGCTYTMSATVSMPSTPLASVVDTTYDVMCFGDSTGSVMVNYNGGTPPYVYQWNNGSTTASLSNVPVGLYTVTVTDANGCTHVSMANINSPSSSLVSSITAQDVNCFGQLSGVITTSANGGTPGYTYQWSNGASTSVLQNVAAGTYSVIIIDANGCADTLSTQINQPPSALSASGTTTPANCLQLIGGTVSLNVNGGVAPYTYLWNNGTTGDGLDSIGAGIYNVIVSDANGCTEVLSFNIIDISDLNATAAGPTSFCVGGNVTLIADSVANAVYQWYQNGAPINGTNAPNFTTHAPGTYTVSVTNQCGTFMSDPIEVTMKSLDNATVSSNQIICPPETAQLYASGGTTYLWTPPSGLSGTTIPNPVAAPVVTMIYTVLITDGSGCSMNASVEVGVVCDSLFVPNGFSPNDDGVNDGFEIPGIETYPGNKLWVYNRWGNLIFKAKDYKNEWDGKSNISGNYLGETLPNGTYYYILDLNNGTKPLSGYVVLRR